MDFGMQRWPRRSVGIWDTKLKAGTEAGKQLLATALSDFLWVRSWAQCETGLSAGEESREKSPFPQHLPALLVLPFQNASFPCLQWLWQCIQSASLLCQPPARAQEPPHPSQVC